MSDRCFGISTRLFRDVPLTRDHLVHIAAHGFDAVELYAAPGHVDLRSESAVADLAEWLSDTRLRLHAVHAAETSPEAIAPAIALASRIPFAVLVVHRPPSHTEKILHALAAQAAPAGVKVAVEARSGRDASVAALVALHEDEDADAPDVGICFDFGHANLAGDVSEALELASGHIVTTHVHDNRGRQDDRLVPYAGRIHWDEAMMEIQKVGYDGALIFEYASGGDPVDILTRTMKARGRLEKAFITF